MWLREVVVAILFVCLSNSQDLYHVPEPTIEVFNPERFRISIEDSAGITFVAFQVNINEDLHQQQVGEFSKEIFYAVNGRWTFDVSNAHIKVGDKVHYWLFLIKDHMGFRKLGTYSLRELDNGSFEASVSQPTRPPPNQVKPQAGNCKTFTDDVTQAIPTPTQAIPTATSSSTPERNQDSYLNPCEHFLLNTTQNLLALQSQVENMRKNNEQLTELLEMYPGAKKLTLTGKIPSNNDPAMTVRFIIREKLDLNPDIVSAVRISDNSIEFKVASVAEKLEILEVAKATLVNSRFTIS